VTASWLGGAGWTIIGVILGIGAIAGLRVAARDRNVRKIRFGFFWERERDQDEREPPVEED
jgi:hypothetical protein